MDSIVECWGHLLDVTIESNSVSIKNLAMRDLILIKESLIREEIAIELLLNIFYYLNNSIYDYSVQLNYNESQIRKTISKINDFLSTAGAEIEYYKGTTESKPTIMIDDEIKLFRCTIKSNPC